LSSRPRMTIGPAFCATKIVHGSDFYQLTNYCEYKKMIGRLSIENRPYGLNNITLGVSICLDVIKEWVSTVERTSTASKSVSRESRNLDRDRDFSISSWHQCSDQKVSIEIERFVEIWKFRRFSTVCLDLDREMRGFLYFLVKISQSVKTFHHFQTQKASTMSRFLDKSWQSRQKSRRFKVSTEKKKSWSWPSRKSWLFKKVSLDTKDVLDLDLDWSRPPCLK